MEISVCKSARGSQHCLCPRSSCATVHHTDGSGVARQHSGVPDKVEVRSSRRCGRRAAPAGGLRQVVPRRAARRCLPRAPDPPQQDQQPGRRVPAGSSRRSSTMTRQRAIFTEPGRGRHGVLGGGFSSAGKPGIFPGTLPLHLGRGDAHPARLHRGKATCHTHGAWRRRCYIASARWVLDSTYYSGKGAPGGEADAIIRMIER